MCPKRVYYVLIKFTKYRSFSEFAQYWLRRRSRKRKEKKTLKLMAYAERSYATFTIIVFDFIPFLQYCKSWMYIYIYIDAPQTSTFPIASYHWWGTNFSNVPKRRINNTPTHNQQPYLQKWVGGIIAGPHSLFYKRLLTIALSPIG